MTKTPLVLLLAAAGLQLGSPAAAQIELRLDAAEGMQRGPLTAGEDLLLSARMPARSESGLDAELPAIWIDEYSGRAVALSEAACQARIDGFERNLAFNTPTVDLLAYQLASLSADGVLTVLDPRGGFGSSRMLDRLELPAKPGRYWHHPEGQRLFVALPSRPSLAMIDTGSWDLLHEIPLDAPLLELGFSAGNLWASTAAGKASALFTFDSRSGETLAKIALPGEASQVLFAEDTLFAILDGRLWMRPAPPAEPAWRDLGRAAARLAYSEAAAALVVLTPGGGLALLESSGEGRAELPAARGSDRRLDLSPDGRWAFTWAPGESDLRVADLARQSWRGELRVEAPSELAFSEQFLYVRSLARAEILVTPLDSLDSPGLVAGKLVAGGTEPNPTPLRSSMASLPGGGAMFWTSTSDQQIYAYHEGMNAAGGSLQHPRAKPLDLLLTGPLLREVAPGAFAARLSLPKPGRYLVAAASRQPAAIACRLFDVVGEDGNIPVPARLGQVELPKEWPAGKTFSLRFDIEQTSEEQEAALVGEIPVLVMSTSGTWQDHFYARRREGSTFEAEISIPVPGPHFVIIRWQPPEGRESARRFSIRIVGKASAGEGKS